jgi:hypothetical protein
LIVLSGGNDSYLSVACVARPPAFIRRWIWFLARPGAVEPVLVYGYIKLGVAGSTTSLTLSLVDSRCRWRLLRRLVTGERLTTWMIWPLPG